MAVGFVVRFLFGLALLAQALSPSSAGFAMPAANGAAAIGPLCAILHGSEAKKATAAGSEQAPKNDPAHRHGLCSYCQIGSGAPPFATRLAPTALLRLTWTRAVFTSDADVILVFRGNHNAPARAPPSFA